MNVRFVPRDSSCEKINRTTWKIFCKKEITIPPRTPKGIELSFGVEIANGMIVIALCNDLKTKCVIQNEIVLESVDNICIFIQNNSSDNVIIKKDQPICLLKYFS